jgi:hypothetical protein
MTESTESLSAFSLTFRLLLRPFASAPIHALFPHDLPPASGAGTQRPGVGIGEDRMESDHQSRRA